MSELLKLGIQTFASITFNGVMLSSSLSFAAHGCGCFAMLIVIKLTNNEKQTFS
jgi:hypothetical protein